MRQVTTSIMMMRRTIVMVSMVMMTVRMMTNPAIAASLRETVFSSAEKLFAERSLAT